jgi:hypothetical protein
MLALIPRTPAGKIVAHRSLRITAAKVALGMADTSELIAAAHDALDNGVYAQGLGELVTCRDPTWADCHPFFVSALRELQVAIPDHDAAVLTLLEFHVVRLAEGAAAPDEVLYNLYSIERELRDQYPHQVSPESWEALQPFVDLYHHVYYRVDELYGYQNYEWEQGRSLPADHVLDELYAEAVALAIRWCSDRWGPILNPSWLTSDVIALASGIYTERAFDRLPILADALQDAGCDNADILDHCRGSGPHVRGCWVVDLLLGKA